MMYHGNVIKAHKLTEVSCLSSTLVSFVSLTGSWPIELFWISELSSSEFASLLCAPPPSKKPIIEKAWRNNEEGANNTANRKMEITVNKVPSVSMLLSICHLTKENDWNDHPEVGHCQVVGHQSDCPLRQALLSVNIWIQGKLWNIARWLTRRVPDPRVTCISRRVLKVITLSLIFWIVTIHDLLVVLTLNCVSQPFWFSFRV